MQTDNLDDLEDLNDLEDPMNSDTGDNVDNDDNDNDDGDDTTPAPASMTPQEIAQLAAQTAMNMQPRTQPQQQLSPEELDARLNRYKVNAEMVKLLRDPEADPNTIVQKLQELVDGAAKHAVTSSQLLFQDALSPLQQRIEAQQAYVREQQTQTFAKHVETKYPALAGRAKVVRQAIEHVANSGWTPPNGSRSAAQKQVALVAQQIIRSVDPSFSLKAGNNAQRQASSFGSRRNSGGGGDARQSRSGANSFLDHLH